MTRVNCAFITGVGSGVGLEICKTLLKNGWIVHGVGRKKLPPKSLTKISPEKFNYYSADITKPAQVGFCFKQVFKKNKVINLLVNNAGVFKSSPFEDYEISDIDRMIDVNLKGLIYTTFYCLEGLKSSGRIINISSVAGIHGIENQSVYCASKYGVQGFSEALNQELIKKNISITTISPGGIKTPLWNEKENPYRGDSNKILQAKDIAMLVQYIAGLPNRIIFKSAVIFPSNEWH